MSKVGKEVIALLRYSQWHEVVSSPLSEGPPKVPSHSPLSTVVCVKVVCHLQEGLGVLLFDGVDGLWLSVLPLTRLAAVLKELHPSVELKAEDVLLRVQRYFTEGTPEERIEISTALPSETSDPLPTSQNRHPTLHGDLMVSIKVPIDILENYSIELKIPIQVQCLTKDSLDWRTVFSLCVIQPLCAQRLALTESLLLVCNETKTDPHVLYERLRDQFKTKFSDSRALGGDWIAAQQQTASLLLNSYTLPPPLNCFNAFENNLLKFVDNAPNDFVEMDKPSTASTTFVENKKKSREENDTNSRPLKRTTKEKVKDSTIKKTKKLFF